MNEFKVYVMDHQDFGGGDDKAFSTSLVLAKSEEEAIAVMTELFRRHYTEITQPITVHYDKPLVSEWLGFTV